MTALQIRPFAEGDRSEVIELWRESDLLRPWNDPNADIDRKIAHSPEGLIVATIGGEVVGAVMVGYDGHRGWINYLATAQDRRRNGIGWALMETAREQLADAGCAKVNLQIRAENQAVQDFYRAIGYESEDALSMGFRMIDEG